VLVAGGGSGTSERLSVGPVRPDPGATMIEGRFNGCSYCLLSDGSVMVVGGQQLGTGARLASAEIFHVGIGTWVQCQPVPGETVGVVAIALLDGRVLVCGGERPGDGRGEPPADPRMIGMTSSVIGMAPVPPRRMVVH